ncbi:enoyl-CoA hydratase-related protein [Niallia sp. Krafla_26]|uniref:enoyl-CoA hydratase-related protein n=1 Tax=Niallia sp. Krafla_26 TaxID=3064703 RepID=UPI003D164899
MSKVLYSVENHIAYVTINRPEVLNCFDYETLEQLADVVNQIEMDQDVRVAIFTGAGEKAFSAGADLKERKTLSVKEVRRNVKAIRDVFNQISQLPQPTIAAVNGYAFGGGFELILACDFAIAVPEAKVGLTETSWAIIPGAGGTQRLPRLIGEMRAKELIFTAKKLTAQEAYDWGILTRVINDENVVEASISFAKEMLQNGPVALKQAKYAICNGMNVDLQTGLAIESKAYELTIPTEDRLEALTAFSEKRKPAFKGK